MERSSLKCGNGTFITVGVRPSNEARHLDANVMCLAFDCYVLPGLVVPSLIDSTDERTHIVLFMSVCERERNASSL